MSWFKVDDSFYTHWKVMDLAVGPCRSDAIALWLMAGNWSAHAEKEGFVPRGVVASFAFHAEAPVELLRVGLWEPAEGGFRFHDWADYQPSGEALEERRRKGAQRKAKSRERLSKAKSDVVVSSDVGVSQRDCVSVTGGVTGVPRIGLTGSGSSDLNSSSQISDPEEEKVLSDTAREAPAWRRPVSEPPSGFVDTYREPEPAPPEPTLEERILTAWKRGVFERTTRTPVSSKQTAAGAAAVASWLRDNTRPEEKPLEAFQAALRQYLNEDKDALRKACWPLMWLVERLPGYLASAPKPQTAAVRPQWEPPAWQRAAEASEQAEIKAAIAETLSAEETVSLSRSLAQSLRRVQPAADELLSAGAAE